MKNKGSSFIGLISTLFTAVIFAWLFIFILAPEFSKLNPQSGLIFVISGIFVFVAAIAILIKGISD